MGRVDVHVLVHEGTEDRLLSRCLDSLIGQDCNLFVVDNTGHPVGTGRYLGYQKGQRGLVSYIDSDDYALPGVFAAMADAMEEHHAVVCWERIEWENGYILPNPVRFHAPVCYRRSDVKPYLPAIKAAHWCADALLRLAIRPVQLPVIGQVRMHRRGTASSRVTGDTQQREAKVWRSLTAQTQ